MSITTQDLQDLSMGAFAPSALDRNFPFTDVPPSIPQLSDNVDPLPPPIPEPIDSASYSESDYDWLVNVLDALIKFMHRDENWSIPELEENDYAWAHTLLVELVDAVGESETHPLRSLMEFVCRLVVDYEDKYVPKLTELFPELAAEDPIEITNENSNPPPYASELSDSELAAHAFFSIGCLLWEGGKAQKALSAYDTAIRLQPDYAEVYNNRGNIKNRLGHPDDALADYNEAICLNPHFAEAYYNRAVQKVLCEDFDAAIVDYTEAIRLKPDYTEAYAHRGIAQAELGNMDEARSDLQTALALSEQQGNADFKVLVEKWLRRLEQLDLKQNRDKQPRRGGQWKGKVQIADDFDELPESFMEGFHGDKE